MTEFNKTESDNAIRTEHNLDFEVAESDMGMHFRVGTCKGLYGITHDTLYILSVINETQNNGHLNDVFQWFEYSCASFKKNLMVLEIMNSKFYLHLISKRGFIPMDAGGSNVVKVFNKSAYKKMVRKGNEIIRAKTLECV